MRLAVSEDGLLGFIVDNCAHILDTKNMKIAGKACGEDSMEGASYSHGIFAFVGWDNNVYLFKGGKYWKKVKVDRDYRRAVTVLPDGFIACYEYCAKFTFDGEKVWDKRIGGIMFRTAVHRGYVYVPDMWKRALLVFRLRNGETVNEIKYGEFASTAVVCRNYLAVGEWNHVYLYDISDPKNPKELWRKDGFGAITDIAFSPDCNTVAVCDEYNQRLVLLSSSGYLVGKVECENEPLSVAWGRSVLAVELTNRLLIWKFEEV